MLAELSLLLLLFTSPADTAEGLVTVSYPGGTDISEPAPDWTEFGDPGRPWTAALSLVAEASDKPFSYEQVAQHRSLMTERAGHGTFALDASTFDPSTLHPTDGDTPAEDEPAAKSGTSEGDGRIELVGAARVIADCESGDRLANGTAADGTYDWRNINSQGPGGTPLSTASGAFQFLDGTWRWVAHEELGYTQYARAKHAPPHVQLEAFEWLFDGGNGKHHWNASRSCWGGRL